MDCEEYRRYYLEYTDYPIPKDVWDTPHYHAWISHQLDCNICSDWGLAQQILQQGHNPAEWPCIHVAYYAIYECDEHANLNDCSRAVILYIEKFDEYVIGSRGGTGDHYNIKYCPQCGVKLPPSKRNLYFEHLEKMGVDSVDDEIPLAYQSSAWFKNQDESFSDPSNEETSK